MVAAAGSVVLAAALLAAAIRPTLLVVVGTGVGSVAALAGLLRISPPQGQLVYREGDRRSKLPSLLEAFLRQGAMRAKNFQDAARVWGQSCITVVVG